MYDLGPDTESSGPTAVTSPRGRPLGSGPWGFLLWSVGIPRYSAATARDPAEDTRGRKVMLVPGEKTGRLQGFPATDAD